MFGTIQTTVAHQLPDDLPGGMGTRSLVQIHPLDLDRGPIPLGSEPVRLGRSGRCEIQIEDDSVSRQHAEIRCCGEQHEIVDLGSTNGILVNGRAVTAATLQTGDRIQLGARVFRFLADTDLEAQYHETVYAMMTRDGLTGAFNKRYLLESLQREVARCRRHGRPLAVALMDIDRFKSINDTHGHLAGDDVLRELASRLHQTLRDDEILARFGGEEFAIVMVELGREAAVEVAERCRRVVEADPFATSAGPLDVTISLGVAAPPPADVRSPETLLELADERLYQAKRSGRNRVVG